MSRATVVDPSHLADEFRREIRAEVQELPRQLTIVGLLGENERDDSPAAVYARYAGRACESLGIHFDLRRVGRDAADVVREASADPGVHGVFLYYPLVDRVEDRWLRELVDPRKDIEGMHSFWSGCLYENRRFLDDEQRIKTILPCTPNAILKLLEDAGMRGSGHPRLEGVTACVVNRSEIVGRPLSAMLANDGARVLSVDIDGVQVFEPAIHTHAHTVRDTDLGRADALADADVVITGVPSRDFELVRADEIKEGAICVNFSQFRNFDDSILDKASSFVPRVGPMTVTMAMRNLLRLHRTVQQPSA